MVGTGYLSDLWGRKRAIVTSTFIGIIGLALIYAGGALRYPGDYLGWTLFWGYMVWGLGQGAIGQFGPWYSELYPVEMRSTATSTIFTTGRLVGSVAPYLVPVIAAAVGSLRDAMMLAVVGSVISFVFAFMLPETAGRRFAVVDHVVDSKEKVEESENN